MIRSVEGNLRISKLTSPNVQCYKNDNTTTTNTTTTTTTNNNNNNNNNNNSNEIEESMESIYSKLSQNNERQMYECIVSLCMIYL